MSLPSVIVSGKNGQVGQELQLLTRFYPQFHFFFYSKDELDISNFGLLENYFTKHQPSFFINCAAYTAVDKAETEQQAAYKINAEASGNIATICKQHNTTFIHISTDYVFDGTNNTPYKEEDTTNPVNYYGYTKLAGEKFALENNKNSIIIRTSWVYSSFGSNFVKTMLRLMKEKSELRVVNDQLGSPTYAKDLADAIMKIVNREASTATRKSEIRNSKFEIPFGIFHFSNDGIISWFDFACAIRDIKNLNCAIYPIPTSAYPTPAKRPAYSGLNKGKIVSAYNIQLKNWKDSLKECLKLL